jgi:hypothetical protein
LIAVNASRNILLVSESWLTLSSDLHAQNCHSLLTCTAVLSALSLPMWIFTFQMWTLSTALVWIVHVLFSGRCTFVPVFLQILGADYPFPY